MSDENKLPLETIIQGGHCSYKKPKLIVIKRPCVYNAVQRRLRPYVSSQETFPPVDFSRNMIIGAFKGMIGMHRPGIYHIDSIVQTDGGLTVVTHYHNQGVMMPEPCTPYHLVKTQRYDGRVVIKELDARALAELDPNVTFMLTAPLSANDPEIQRILTDHGYHLTERSGSRNLLPGVVTFTVEGPKDKKQLLSLIDSLKLVGDCKLYPSC